MTEEDSLGEKDTVGKGLHQNIGRATLVLSTLANASTHGLRLTDVVQATGLGKATVHRVLAGLVTYGLAEQDEATGRFFLGMKIVSWASAAANRFGLARLAEPALQRLCEKTQDTIYLAIRVGDEAVYLDRREGTFPIKTLTVNVGDRRPLGVGAAPLALLAFLPDEEREELVSAKGDARTEFGVDELALREMMDASRELGYALNDGKIIAGMSAVAVPVFGRDERPLAAISVAAVSTRMQAPRREQVVASLQEEARQIESNLKPLFASGSTMQLVR